MLTLPYPPPLQVFEVSIVQSCDSILNPEAPLALRLSGQLLLGVVRIYQRKLTFLETDAKNAIDGLQRKEGGNQNVDLPDGGTAPETAITLPDSEAGLFGAVDLFPTFGFVDAAAAGLASGQGLASRLSTGMGGAESLTFAEDISDVFGSTRWTASDERFDLVGGEDIDRRFSAELERLRSAAAVEAPRAAASDLFFDAPVDDSYGAPPPPMDEIMEPPGAHLFAEATAALPTPGSAGAVPLPGTSDNRFTPSLSFGMSDVVLPDVGGMDELGMATDSPPTSPARGAAAARRARQNHRRKRAILDIDDDGNPATQLPQEEIRQLLNDRAPLLTRRGLRPGEAALLAPPPCPYDVVIQSEAARESFLYRPACFDRLHPHLLVEFNRGMGIDDEIDATRAQGRRDNARHNEGHEALLAEEAAHAVEGPEPSLGGGPSPAQSWGAGDDGLAYSDGGMDFDGGGDYREPDFIEASQPEERPGFLGGADLAAPALAIEALPRPADSRLSLDALAEEEAALSGGARGGDTVVSGGESERGTAGYARDGFTARTKVVLDHLQQRFFPPQGSGMKRRHPASAAGLAPAVESLSLDGLVQGRPRLEACRWFFEALVLKNKGYVDLRQAAPYGEIAILPLDRMANERNPGNVEEASTGVAVSA